MLGGIAHIKKQEKHAALRAGDERMSDYASLIQPTNPHDPHAPRATPRNPAL
jgi:hypothetical protein